MKSDYSIYEWAKEFANAWGKTFVVKGSKSLIRNIVYGSGLVSVKFNFNWNIC